MEGKSSREERREREIEALIERFDMERKCSMSREQIRAAVLRSMVLNNFAFICADLANTFLLDCEHELKRFGVVFRHGDKYNFNQMLTHIHAARKWSAKSTLPLYEIEDKDNACAESDWWYSLMKLIDDRIGSNNRKTNMFLEWLLAMPSEENIFDVTYDDFKHFKL